MTKTQRKHHKEIKNLVAAGDEASAQRYRVDNNIGSGLFHRAVEAGRSLRREGK